MTDVKEAAQGGSHGLKSDHSLTFSNYGNTCTDLNVELVEGGYTFSPDHFALVPMGQRVSTHLILPKRPPFQSNVLRLTFVDSSGLPGEVSFPMAFKEETGYSTPVLELIG